VLRFRPGALPVPDCPSHRASACGRRIALRNPAVHRFPSLDARPASCKPDARHRAYKPMRRDAAFGQAPRTCSGSSPRCTAQTCRSVQDSRHSCRDLALMEFSAPSAHKHDFRRPVCRLRPEIHLRQPTLRGLPSAFRPTVTPPQQTGCASSVPRTRPSAALRFPSLST
jgi:hypothetical protein